MPLRPEDLENKGYRLLSSLQHMDIIPFVQEQLRGSGPIARSYRFLTMGLLAVSGAFLAYSIIASPGDWGNILTRFSYGLALAFLLAPIHELIHGVALKAVGAPSVQYRANWRKLYLMAAADRFVVGEKAFYIVAFAPFAVISLAALALLAWHPLTALGLLFLHTAFCAGDFALSEYMHAYREKEILTYDLVDEQISYFYVKEE
ncbi:MAG: DUF3267 domain-containing protein [Saprospiraceae bacterium]